MPSFDLRELLAPYAENVPAGVMVQGISSDTRKLKKGDLFFALSGSRADGRSYIIDAANKGAAAIVGEGKAPDDLAPEVPYASVRDARRVLACVAARFYQHQPKTIVAVTGTNGKTSVASFTRQIWTALGKSAASLGTTGVTSPKGEIKGSLTTPDPIALHALLAKLADEGVTHLAMEASSHGLEQRRLDGVRLDAAAFTNLTRDHLDYHQTMESYLAAKLRLFDTLMPEATSIVVDADQPDAAKIEKIAKDRKLKFFSVGRAGRNLKLLEAKRDGFAQALTIGGEGRKHSVCLPLVGDFQVSNALVAAGLAMVTGGECEKVLATLEKLQGASGRLELIGEKDGAPVFVDYAHTPDALENALNALRPYVTGKLVVVFGAGGDRDTGKRVLMGAAAVELADRIYVTDDNPRSEDPAEIRRQILKAAPGAIEIGDRAEAIKTAIDDLAPGDVLLIAGKGHETGQIVGQRTLPFSDQAEVRSALGISG